MKSENTRNGKRPRLKPKPKQEVLFSTDKVQTGELFEIFTANIFKKKDPFAQ